METITVDGTDYDLEHSIEVAAGLWWMPYHSWCDGIDQIDARLVTSSGAVVPDGLDIWAVEAARAECAPERVALLADTEDVWAAGGVLAVGPEHFGARSLFVPGAELTDASVRAALARFRP